jgi:hypothetical protein
VGDHLLGTARSVRHTAVERKDLEPVIVAPADERVKPPAQPVDLDNVPSPNPLEPHREQGYAGAMTAPPELAEKRKEGSRFSASSEPQVGISVGC